MWDMGCALPEDGFEEYIPQISDHTSQILAPELSPIVLPNHGLDHLSLRLELVQDLIDFFGRKGAVYLLVY